MYTPPQNRQQDPEEIAAFMREFSFATLVTCGEGGMVASQIPLSFVRDGATFRLSGHIAKANQQAAHLAAGAGAMAIFAAPHGYVSPQNYEPGKWVPTWNYVAVHAYGIPEVREDRAAKLAALASLVGAYEPGFQATLDAYPPEFVDAKLKGIVAFEIEVTRLDARWKLSQDRQPAERERISLALRLSSDPSANRLASFMEQRSKVLAS